MTTQFDARRRRILALGGLLASFPAARLALAQPAIGKSVPDPANFRSGDLVWPKKSGAFVPYSGASSNLLVDEAELGEAEWTRERALFIRNARSMDPKSPEYAYASAVASRLEEMSYSDFFHDYAGGTTAARYQTYGLGDRLYVGHVGVLEVDADSKKPYVIEAIMGQAQQCAKCVQRVEYDRWLKDRGDILVWHGRVRGVDAAAGSGIAAAARKMLGKPYQFFNWNLLNESGFYCSKLAWYAVFKATGIALDGDSDPARKFWFSPLQAMRSDKTIEMLFSPGDYQSR